MTSHAIPDSAQLQQALDACWEQDVLPSLAELIRIPSLSPLFDPDWAAHGELHRAAAHVAQWMRQMLPEARVNVFPGEGRTPLLLLDLPGETAGSVLFYAHLDKQPPQTGWREGLGAWKPVLEDGRLYGRGGADDGYAAYTAVAVAKTLRELGIALPRIVVLVECSEESGSPDLAAHLDAHAGEIGTPDLVICLDSACGDYERLWCTTSLRGLILADVQLRVLREGVHSGAGSGIAPNPLMILRALLSRLEDPHSGRILLPELWAAPSEAQRQETFAAAHILGQQVIATLPFEEGVRPLHTNPGELLLQNTWAPALAITGIDGVPTRKESGNVLLPEATLRLSIRLSPGVSAEAALAAIHNTLESDPPFGAQIHVEGSGEDGWVAPEAAPWLQEALEHSSQRYYSQPACHLGIGGSIPFMRMMSERFPQAQFFVSGVLGPGSNAHGPNEFLHIPYVKRLSACVAELLCRCGGTFSAYP